MLTVGSLFTGIGGIDLGLERTGHFRTIWMAEIDNYASKVLAKHWPDVPNLGNVKEINYERLERPDVLIGGYPCQPFSIAGQRGGASDPRHLWPECLRALRVLRPRYAVFENVRGHLSLGFSEVLSDLAAIGFNAEWQVIPASAIGAPHRRDRLFILAYSDSEPRHGRGHSNRKRTIRESATVQEPVNRGSSIVAHAESGTRSVTESHNLREIFRQTSKLGKQTSDSRPDNNWWQVEPDVGRVAHGVPARVDRLRALGNAVVPQVAEVIGYMIAEHAANA